MRSLSEPPQKLVEKLGGERRTNPKSPQYDTILNLPASVLTRISQVLSVPNSGISTFVRFSGLVFNPRDMTAANFNFPITTFGDTLHNDSER